MVIVDIVLISAHSSVLINCRYVYSLAHPWLLSASNWLLVLCMTMENVRAVGKAILATSVTLPVPERIGVGKAHYDFNDFNGFSN